jgi:hypothetical protein
MKVTEFLKLLADGHTLYCPSVGELKIEEEKVLLRTRDPIDWEDSLDRRGEHGWKQYPQAVVWFLDYLDFVVLSSSNKTVQISVEELATLLTHAWSEHPSEKAEDVISLYCGRSLSKVNGFSGVLDYLEVTKRWDGEK